MSGVDFLDSNILLYTLDGSNPTKQGVASRLVKQAHLQRTGVISFQVVQETLQVISRKFQVAVRPEDRQTFLRNVLVPLWRVMPSTALYGRALELQARYQYSFYDSLILAAALESGCTRVLSEDLQDGQRIEGLTIENPFKD
ncbi:MAG: PIN domain-containing protein [Candidatus Competibacteraceae bacterium]|nr:PIN domain-containing protein [Candidatus Competibacteraceae bacterium]MBK9949970.1 PIN domain-containing protein [Candidatus Competibacteraceae bacterium]